MSFKGARLEDLDGLEEVLRSASQVLAESATNIRVADNAATWLGPDAEEFRDNWYRLHQPNLVNIQNVLSNLAREVVFHRQEQFETSEGGSAGGAAPVLLTPPTPPVTGDVPAPGNDEVKPVDQEFYSQIKDLADSVKDLTTGSGISPHGGALSLAGLLTNLLGGNDLGGDGLEVLGTYLSGADKLHDALAFLKASPADEALLGGPAGFLDVAALGLAGWKTYNLIERERDPEGEVRWYEWTDLAGDWMTAIGSLLLKFPTGATQVAGAALIAAGVLAKATAYAGEHWGEIKDFANERWNETKELAQSMSNLATDVGDSVVQTAGNMIDSAAETAKDVAGAVSYGAHEIVDFATFWN